MKYLLACNAGSSSLKFAVFRLPKGEETLRGNIDQISTRHPTLTLKYGRTTRRTRLRSMPSHADAVVEMQKQLQSFRKPIGPYVGLVHRIVVGGAYERPMRLTPQVIHEIAGHNDEAPLHNPTALASIRASMRCFPNVPQYVCFDSAFFSSLPDVAKQYAIDGSVARMYRIQRRGFHGLSHASAVRHAAHVLHKPVASLHCIVAHLGSGCSITAIRNGKPIDTSMGFTPLEGLMMGKRCGDIDPGILLFLLRNGFRQNTLEQLLNRRSGLLGVSGFSSDLREIFIAAGHQIPGYRMMRRPTPAQRRRSRQALRLFCYRVQKYIGAYSAMFERLDAIVFTGAAGAMNRELQKMIIAPMFLRKKPRILAFPPDEEREMFYDARRIIAR